MRKQWRVSGIKRFFKLTDLKVSEAKRSITNNGDREENINQPQIKLKLFNAINNISKLTQELINSTKKKELTTISYEKGQESELNSP